MRLALAAAVLLSGCVSTKVALSKDWHHARKPDYEDYFDYYLFGTIGRNNVDIQRACMERRPEGFERTRTVEDGILTYMTLGIYSPLTVRVWCTP